MKKLGDRLQLKKKKKTGQNNLFVVKHLKRQGNFFSEDFGLANKTWWKNALIMGGMDALWMTVWCGCILCTEEGSQRAENAPNLSLFSPSFFSTVLRKSCFYVVLHI